MRFRFLIPVVFLAGCTSVQEQAQVAQKKAAALGNRIETKVTETGANVQRKTRTFWQWLTGSGGDSSTKKPAKRHTADSAAATPAPLDTVPQQYVGGQSR